MTDSKNEKLTDTSTRLIMHEGQEIEDITITAWKDQDGHSRPNRATDSEIDAAIAYCEPLVAEAQLKRAVAYLTEYFNQQIAEEGTQAGREVIAAVYRITGDRRREVSSFGALDDRRNR